jgi:hypothetical protein
MRGTRAYFLPGSGGAEYLLARSCPHGREIGVHVQSFRRHRPLAFAIDGLLPGERYVLAFSGVHRDDAMNRVSCEAQKAVFPPRHGSRSGVAQVCDFFTIDHQSGDLRILCVSGDRPEAVGAAEFNLWETIYERLKQKHLPQVCLSVCLRPSVRSRTHTLTPGAGHRCP